MLTETFFILDCGGQEGGSGEASLATAGGVKGGDGAAWTREFLAEMKKSVSYLRHPHHP